MFKKHWLDDEEYCPNFFSNSIYHERGESKIPNRTFLPRMTLNNFFKNYKGEQMNRVIDYIKKNVEQIENGLTGLKENLSLLESGINNQESPCLPDSMQMIEEITKRRYETFGEVSNAEFDFVQGVAESMQKWGSLTPKQSKALENTYRSIILGEEISYK